MVRSIFFICARYLAIVLLTFSALNLAQAQQLVRYALVIGNDNYATSKLENAVSDARLVGQALQDVGFKVTRLENATQEQMLGAIERLQANLESIKGVGLFYYAGHGVQVRGENYLIPINVSMQQEEVVRSRGVNTQEIIDRMSASKNSLNMIFLDACRNDPYARGRRSASSGLARLDAALGMLIAFSTSPGAVAEDGQGSNSPFAKHLASTLKQPGLKVEDVLKRVRTNVREETRGRQVTWDNSAIEGDFYFQPSQTNSTLAANIPKPVAPQAVEPPESRSGVLPRTSRDAELALWQSVQNTRDKAELELFIKRYPNGEFSDLARRRVQTLASTNKADLDAKKRRYFPDFSSAVVTEKMVERAENLYDRQNLFAARAASRYPDRVGWFNQHYSQMQYWVRNGDIENAENQMKELEERFPIDKNLPDK